MLQELGLRREADQVKALHMNDFRRDHPHVGIDTRDVVYTTMIMLQLVFVILKLAGIVTVSWAIVLLPLWCAVMIGASMAGFMIVSVAKAGHMDWRRAFWWSVVVGVVTSIVVMTSVSWS